MIRRRVLHYRSTDVGQRVALCSTADTRILKPLVAICAYVTCPRCNAILGRKAAAPRTPRSKIGGIGTTDGAAMTEAKIARGVKKRAASKPPKPKPQLEGQLDVFDALAPDDGNYEWMKQ